MSDEADVRREPTETADPNRPDRGLPSYETWKEISQALGVSEDTAQEYANRAYLPLVVFVDHANRVWTPKANVATFINLHHMPLWAHRALKKAKLLPGQIKATAAARRRRRSARRGRTKTEG